MSHKTFLPVPCLWATLCPSATRVTWENMAQIRDSNGIAEIFPYKTRWNYHLDALRPQPPAGQTKLRPWFVFPESTFPKMMPWVPGAKNGTASSSKGTRLFRLPKAHSSELSWSSSYPKHFWVEHCDMRYVPKFLVYIVCKILYCEYPCLYLSMFNI